MVRAETLFCPGSGSAGASRWDNFRLQGRGEREGREGREVSDYVSFLLSGDDPGADRGVRCEAPVFGVTTGETDWLNISADTESMSGLPVSVSEFHN